MKNKIFFIVLSLTFALSSRESFTEEKAAIPEPVQTAIEAADACYHWSEEAGFRDPEEINRGADHDCPDARRKATDAYRLFPTNQYLSLALLKLNDNGTFNLSATEKEKVCKQGVPLLKNGYYGSKYLDGYFRSFCPEHSAMLSHKYIPSLSCPQ